MPNDPLIDAVEGQGLMRSIRRAHAAAEAMMTMPNKDRGWHQEFNSRAAQYHRLCNSFTAIFGYDPRTPHERPWT